MKLDHRVIRVARHAEAAAPLQREVCVLDAIADSLPLRVPRPTYHSPGTCPSFAVHDEVTGEVLTREGWMDMPVPAREKAASDLADFLTALRRISVEIRLECGLARLDAAELARKLRQENP